MGRVYLARDEVLDILVALKVLRDVLRQDPTALKQLKREARLCMGLSHPNVVRVHTFEEGPEEQFLVMEYVEGETLAARLAREETLSEGKAKRIGAEVCQALEHAHGQGVVHRDLKPGNILLTKTGGVKVADFGIARVAKDSTTRLTGLQTSGTLLYMAPEQVMGKAEARSDLYSLGMVLYEMLGGSPPFTTGDISRQILERAPDRLEGVSPKLDALVLRLLAKEPGARFQSAGEVGAALDESAWEGRRKAGAEAEGGSAVAPPASGSGWVKWGRPSVWALVGVAGLLAVVVPWRKSVKRERDTVEWQATQPTAPPVAPSAATPPGLGLGFGPDQFVRIEPGTFWMGSEDGHSDERPAHTVRITRPFLLQKTEVTQAQWREIMGENPSHFSDCGDVCPVEMVSWNDVQEFLRRLNQQNPGKGYRLPTEAEWEYACRAGTLGDYGGTGNLDEMGWYAGNSGNRTRHVARKRPNAWGLYDMHGNVWEWVQDGYRLYSAGSETDPTAPAIAPYSRVHRGGSWANTSRAGYARCAFRTQGGPDFVINTLGFRVARAWSSPESVD